MDTIQTSIQLSIKFYFSSIIAIFAGLTSYLNINTEAFAIYFALLSFDLFTGLIASFLNREKITLARFYAGILSKSLMFIVPIVIALIVKMQGDDLLWFIKWTVIVLAVSEAISILNNVLKANGKAQIPELDAISIIASKLRVILERLFKEGGGK